MPASILIVEDEPSILELLSANARHAGFYPMEAPDVPAARTLLSEVLPDLIVLDWMLPGISGIAFLRELRTDSRTKDVPVIMVTARADEDDSISGLEAGADDYVTKPFSPKELMARVKAVLRRLPPDLESSSVTVDGLTLDPATRRVYTTRDGTEQRLHLGPTEFRLLHFFMTRPERVHSRRLVLEQVWGTDVPVVERTVDVHVKRLRDALKPAGYDTFIETVRGSGYRLSRIATARHLKSAA
ncbi:phosphate regulon transcriptional regulator PhoB [Paraburkholderia flagellata]|uniref:phosphate regulon transcriptional regulator PhoB n=1 Tax=Paraburkholderia flagellata TaxID=2883241 RepID=UPI001F38FC5A|nr:phosphate regulon transcriptional regulator PhoB [Paraburkholderia flagellata]